MQYVLIGASILLILYSVWFLNTLVKSGKSKKIHKNYQAILDNRLLPLGFEKKQSLFGGREKIASYKRDALEITLSYEISFDSNRVSITNGRKSNTLTLSDTNEMKNNFLQILDNWLAENQ